ncbi:MAG: gamma-glutamyltransferase [Holophagaceae bacterium]|nr:gamma-glutamyltransferase [Holophagaceae bacterium]
MLRAWFACLLCFGLVSLGAGVPVQTPKGMVVCQNRLAAEIGAKVLQDGGSAVDAAVATAFALAVVHPIAGNIGGGGFLVARDGNGKAMSYDFREMAPKGASPKMFLEDGGYSDKLHHESHLSVGVPGTVAGLHLAWKERGKLPWSRLVAPAIRLADEGFPVSETLSASLKKFLPEFLNYPATVAAFTKNGSPFEAGDLLRQPDLARSLRRISAQGPAGFYRGETARLLLAEIKRGGGIIKASDLRAYRAKRRRPAQGRYRGFDIIAMPPPSSGGIALIEMLNVLEGYDLGGMGAGSPETAHLVAESMRRAFRDRALYLGDPDFNTAIPVGRLLSKSYAAELRKGIAPDRATASSLMGFQPNEYNREHEQTTHISVVDASRNAVGLTYTLEDNYGSKILVPGAGFLLNNEMGDFNAQPGLTDATGKIGTQPNLARPLQRPLSSMCPAILARDGKLSMVTGSPGGRTIISTVLESVLNVVDFGMDAQAAVDAPRFHHQWLPDRIQIEPEAVYQKGFLEALKAKGHVLSLREGRQGAAQVIVLIDGVLSGGADSTRWADSAAVAQ